MSQPVQKRHARMVPSHLQPALARDPGWRAVFTLVHALFPDDQRVLKHINFPQGHCDFDSLLAIGFSETERLLLTVAASLWSGSSDYLISPKRLVDRLDDRQMKALLQAAQNYRNR